MTDNEILKLKEIMVELDLFDEKINYVTSIDCVFCKRSPPTYKDYDRMKIGYSGLQAGTTHRHYGIYYYREGYWAVCELDKSNDWFKKFKFLGNRRQIEHEVKLGENFI